MFDPARWAAVPFHFWSGVFFLLGGIVGSFLNVCIHRLPLGQSIVSPPSHCPHCQRAIPWYLNIPLVSWVVLRGRCAFCRAPIAPRYVLVELLTGLLFLASWLRFGPESAPLALTYCLLLAGLIVATFIDLEYFIIPDEITVGGVVAGFLASFAFPQLHQAASVVVGLQRSFWGAVTGAGIIYLFLRLGKWLFGRQRLKLAAPSTVYFTETKLILPDQELPYEELFYRKSDAIVLQARRVELVDRGYREVTVRLTQTTLEVGPDRFPTEAVPCLQVVTDAVVVPREAMGLGDVKFMAAIGAFVGGAGVVFSLMGSAVVGSFVGGAMLLAGRGSSRIPYGPYIAVAATVWVFAGRGILHWWLGR